MLLVLLACLQDEPVPVDPAALRLGGAVARDGRRVRVRVFGNAVFADSVGGRDFHTLDHPDPAADWSVSTPEGVRPGALEEAVCRITVVRRNGFRPEVRLEVER